MASRWLLTLFFAAVSTWHYISIALPACEDCTQAMSAIAAGDYTAPFVYRILTPTVIVALGNSTATLASFHLVMLFLFYGLLWAWAERWGGSGLAAVGIACAALSVMWSTYYFSAWAVTEWVLWLAGLMLLTGRWLSQGQPIER